MGRVNYRKPHLLLAAALFALTACGGGNTSEAGNTLKYDTRGLTPQEYSVANLIAADDYGRTVEVSDPSGAAKKYVGLFYFAWLGSQSMTGIYDVNKLEKLGVAIRIARQTLRIVNENIVLALGIKIAVLVLSAVGLAGMWAAVFADVGVAVIAILNASRMLRYKG